MPLTTIKISSETKNRLEKLKVHKKESFENSIILLLDILNICKTDPLRARFKIFELEKMRAKIEGINKSKN